MTITDAVSAASLPIVTGAAAVLALTFTPENINTIILSLVALATAVGIAVVNIMSARTAQKMRAEQTAKIDETLAVSKVTEGHVNSAATRDSSIIEAQKTQLGMQREIIAKLEQQAALLAQSAAIASVSPAVVAAPVPALPPESGEPKP